MTNNIIICSNSLCNISGLSQMSSRLFKYFFDKKINVVYYSMSGKSSKEDYIFYGKNYKDCFFKSKIYNKSEISFDEVCSIEKPNIVISIHDPWLLEFIPLCNYRHTFRWVNWCLFETPSYPEHIMGFTSNGSSRLHIGAILRNVDLNIPVTKMGIGALLKLNCKNIAKDNVYIGIDFDSVCKKDQSKKEVFGNDFEEDDFVFMCVSKNLDRKRLDLVVEAFRKFLDTIPQKFQNKIKLYMHTDLNVRSGGTDLVSQVIELKLANNFFAPSCFTKNQFMTNEELYKRYRACDCYISLTGGEGFGLGYIEALAHNKPVIYTNYGGHAEYCKDRGYPVEVKDFINSNSAYIQWANADIDFAVKQMDKVYIDSKNKLKKQYNKGLDSIFDWKIILEKFYNIVAEDYKNNKNKFNLKRMC